MAKRLAGQQLAKLLQGAGLPLTLEAARSPVAASLRKLASQAALAQEMSIYRKGVGKQASASIPCHAFFKLFASLIAAAGLPVCEVSSILHSMPPKWTSSTPRTRAAPA